jgi:hypothetical protein
MASSSSPLSLSKKKSARRWLKTSGGESQEESNVTLPLLPLSGLYRSNLAESFDAVCNRHGCSSLVVEDDAVAAHSPTALFINK